MDNNNIPLQQNQFEMFTNFLDFGVLTTAIEKRERPIFTEIPKIHQSFTTRGFYAEIKNISFENIQQVLEKTFSQIEGLKYSYVANAFGWDLEYGTAPLEQTVDLIDQRQVKNGRWLAIKAAMKAQDKYSWIHDDWSEQDRSIPPPYVAQRSWGKMECNLFRNITNDSFVIIITRLPKCCRTTFYYIREALRNNFNSKNIIFLERQSYLCLAEGLSNVNGHISNYLLNDMIVREVSSFIGEYNVEERLFS